MENSVVLVDSFSSLCHAIEDGLLFDKGNKTMIGEADKILNPLSHEERIAGCQKIADWCNAGRYFARDGYLILREDMEKLTTADLTGITRDNIFQITMRGMSSLNVRMLTGVSLAVFFNNYNETARMVREILQSTQAYQMNEMDEIVNPPEWKDPE